MPTTHFILRCRLSISYLISAREERQILEEERTADNHECRANRHGCYPEQLCKSNCKAFQCAFGYVAVTPDEVKNVFSWQRDTQITFSYLKEWCEQNRTMDYRLKWRYVDDQPTALIDAAKVVDRMNWNRYYPYKTSGCAYCNFASKPDMMTCGSDKCMSIYRKEYVLMSLNL